MSISVSRMKNKEKRDKVLAKCNGMCAYCGIDLINIRWHMDHVKPVRRKADIRHGIYVCSNEYHNPENDHIDNMLPSCPSCNIAKSSLCLEDFRSIIEDKLTQLLREANYKTAFRYGLIEEKPKKIIFYFETIGHTIEEG